MHVLQALAALSVGGSEWVVVELAEALTAAGHRVTVLGADGPLAGRVRACGAEHLDWPVGRKRPGTLRYIPRLRNWLREHRPGVVHAHSRLPAWICQRALAGLPADPRPRFVTSMHGQYSVSPYSAIMARGERVVAVSEFMRAYTLEHYPATDPRRVVTIHGGADRAQFPHGHRPDGAWFDSVHREFPALHGKRWLCLPARLSRYKGHADFVRLLARLAAGHPDLHGVIVGGGRPGSRVARELDALAGAEGVADRITRVGARLDIREWLAASEIVFNLTRDPPEAFGRTVLEALCLGRPVLAWDHGGVAEILAAMFPGGAVAPGDQDALLKKAERFLQSPPVVPASDAFSLRDAMQAHIDLYRQLAGKQAGAAA